MPSVVAVTRQRSLERAPEASQAAIRRVVLGDAAREREPVVDAYTSTSLREPHASVHLHETGVSLAGTGASCSAGRP